MSLHSEEDFKRLYRRLGEQFLISDIMVRRPEIQHVQKGELNKALNLVKKFRFSAVPTSSNEGRWYDGVFVPTTHPGDPGVMLNFRELRVEDFIPESTPLIDAIEHFRERQWFLTLKATSVSGIVTYTDFSKRAFLLQLFSLLGRFEELSRDLLANEGCGDGNDPGGLTHLLGEKRIEVARVRFERNFQASSQNRFVDTLQFNDVEDALIQYAPWREFLREKGRFKIASINDYKRRTFNEFRDRVMHGREVVTSLDDFPKLLEHLRALESILLDLEDYLREQVRKSASPA